MRATHKRPSWPTLWTLIVICLIIATCFARTPRFASAATPPLTCTSLTAALSSDKTSYIFTATATGSSGPITGYTFNFGDHQSYSFEFSGGTNQNRYQATVTHIYPVPGAYTATVSVNTKKSGKPARISSPGCHTAINNGPQTLVNTGAGNTLGLFAAVFVAGFVAYEIRLRLRHGAY